MHFFKFYTALYSKYTTVSVVILHDWMLSGIQQ